MKHAKSLHLALLVFVILIMYSCNQSDTSSINSTDELLSSNLKIANAGTQKEDSPQKLYSEFQDMMEEVQNMDKSEIENLSEGELLKLAAPLLKVTEGNTKHSKKILKKLEGPLAAISDNAKTLTQKEHTALSNEVEQILSSDINRKTRDLKAEDVRAILVNFNGGNGMSLMSSCESMFDVTPSGQVLLYTGDNFNTANGVCPAGSVFYVQAGTHTGQFVSSSKTGNSWVGVGSGGPTMDGQDQLNWAFSDGMNQNSISWIDIKNYNEHGIITLATTESISIHHMTFNEIGDGKNGQDYGAIFIDNTEDLEITDSYFHNVSAGMRIRFSDGPIVVKDNEALNNGWGFFQCNDCVGGGIRINDNSMERTAQYGSKDVRDWISLVDSYGEETDYIQVNHNRARGHGTTDGAEFGSFIQLADAGGQYQIAEDNIGVSPGQVGIGAEYGYDIIVKNNKMFSVQWTYANVAYNSRNRSYFDSSVPYAPCGDHTFQNNTANWRGSSAHEAWAPPDPANPDSARCGIDFTEIRNNTSHDSSMTANVWSQW